jgi:hypothetical protein
MNRGLWAGVWVLLAGCQAPPKPAELIPPPSRASGAWVVVEDYRPEWEKRPFSGPVTLFPAWKAHPNPWTQLAKEAEAVVGAMPEKPERVDVFVSSFRLVKKDEGPAQTPADPSDTVRFGSQTVADLNGRRNAVAYEKLRSATQAGDAKTATEIGTGLVFQNGDPSVGVTAPGSDVGAESAPGVLGDHPPGASCRMRATVRVVYPGGKEQQVEVRALAVGENAGGSKYYGEALDQAVKSVVRQFGNQVRQGVGLPPDG